MNAEELADIMNRRDDARTRMRAALERAARFAATPSQHGFADISPVVEGLTGALRMKVALEQLRERAYQALPAPVPRVDGDEDYVEVLIAEYQTAHRQVKALQAELDAVTLPDESTWVSVGIPEEQRIEAQHAGLAAIVEQLRLELDLDDAAWDEQRLWQALEPWRDSE